MVAIPEPPDWLKARLTEDEKKRPVGNPRWYPGMPSPNKSGRPKGIVDRRMRITQALAEDAEDIVAVVKAAAREGDLQAIGMILSRIAPPLKAESGTVEFELDVSGTPAEMSAQILSSVSKGELSPDVGKTLLDMVSAHINLRDVESLLAEFQKLKQSRGNQRTTGTVVTVTTP